MSRKISVTRARKYFAVIWFLSTGILFFIILIQSILGNFEVEIRNREFMDFTEGIWSWFFSIMLPTLSLILGVMIANILMKKKDKKASVFLFRLSLAISAIYLLVVFITYISAFVSPVDKTPVEFLNQSNLWLAPTQGLTTASLGAFFVSPEQE